MFTLQVTVVAIHLLQKFADPTVAMVLWGCQTFPRDGISQELATGAVKRHVRCQSGANLRFVLEVRFAISLISKTDGWSSGLRHRS